MSFQGVLLFLFLQCLPGTMGFGNHLVKSIATSHDLGPQKVAFWKGNGTPYFREIKVGEILLL